MPDQSPSFPAPPDPVLFDPAPFEIDPRDPAPPRTEAEAVERYLGCSPERLREVEEHEGLARALLLVHGLGDWEALGLLLDDCVPGWFAEPDRLLGVLLAMAQMGATLTGLAAAVLRKSPATLLADQAAVSGARLERTLDALEAIADGVDAEPRAAEIVEMCEEMLGEAAVAAAVDGIVLDRDEMLDIELRALMVAEASHREPTDGFP